MTTPPPTVEPDTAALDDSRDLQRTRAYRAIDSGLVWRTSPEFQEWHRSGAYSAQRSLLIAALFLLAFLMTWPFLPLAGPGPSRALVEALLIFLGGAAVGFAVTGTSRYVALRRAFYDRVRVAKAKAVTDAVERLREGGEEGTGLRLPNLIVLNRRQLDEYHVLSVRQQQVAFRNAQFAAVAGFLVLVAGIVLSFQQEPGTGRYVTAGLTALGSLLSGFISAVFFRSSDATAKQLRDFYEEPFRTGQVLMIERVAALDAAQSSDDGQLRRLMVEHLLKELDARRSGGLSGRSTGSGRHGRSPAEAPSNGAAGNGATP